MTRTIDNRKLSPKYSACRTCDVTRRGDCGGGDRKKCRSREPNQKGNPMSQNDYNPPKTVTDSPAPTGSVSTEQPTNWKAITTGGGEGAGWAISGTDTDGQRVLIATVTQWPQIADDKSVAKLIAAAPELLEALESLLNSLLIEHGMTTVHDQYCAKARNAIQKARGE